MIDSIKDRLEARIQKTPNCWLWTGFKQPRGYGIIRYRNKLHLVHRLVYEVFVDNIPEGLVVCHSCDNPPCCNPAHLWTGTMKDNMRDMRNKGRDNWKHGVENGRAKLTSKNILEIRRKYSEDPQATTISLGEEFGVSSTNISDIVNNRTWKHVKGD